MKFLEFKVGELVKWMAPMDSDFLYGYIKEKQWDAVLIEGTGYYKGRVFQVPYEYIKKIGGEGNGRNTKQR